MRLPHAIDLAGSLCDYFATQVVVEGNEQESIALLPMRDLHGDSITLYIESSPYGLSVSDGGFVHHELAAMSGSVKADAEIWTRVEEVAKRFGIAFDGGELNASVGSVDQLGGVALAIASAVTESLYLGRGTIPSVSVQFWEEVELFFRDNEIVHETGSRLLGVSGAKHKIDFVLQNGSVHVVQAIASEQSMRRSLNIFYDLTEGSSVMRPIAFVDNEKSGYSNSSFQQLSYKARVFEWRQRGLFLDYWSSVHAAN